MHFCNPGMLGTVNEFRRHFEHPILRSRDAGCTEKEHEKGLERLSEMGQIVNRCIIRRTNALLSKYLPPKVEQIVVCRMTPLQTAMYKAFAEANAAALSASGKSARQLSSITTLKKLCNHPGLLFENAKISDNSLGVIADMFPDSYDPRRFEPNLSGKFMLLDMMLALIHSSSDDKVVLVSNYTQVLHLFF